MRSLLVAVGLLSCLLGASSARATSDEEEGEGESSARGYRDASGHAEARTVGDLRVSIRTGPLRPPRGFAPVDVALQNTGPVPLTVRLTFRGHSGGGTRVTERVVEVPPRQRLVAWVHVPASLYSGNLQVDVVGQDALVSPVYLDGVNSATMLVLGALKDFDGTSGVPVAGSSAGPLFSLRTIEPRDAPRELAAYVGYPVVMVPGDPLSVPADVWAALESYAATGGRLVLNELSSGVRERLPLLDPGDIAAGADYGFGQVWLCPSALECGQVLKGLLRTPLPGPVNPAGLAPRWERGNLLAGGFAPLLDNARAPVGRFLLLIFLFVLAVGPGSLMLARRRGPVAVLVAVPMVSVITCAALIAWSVLVDGFSVHSLRHSLTLLDSERSRAVTLGVAAWYANMSVGAVSLPATSALLAPESVGADDATLELDWTHGLTVKNNFLPPRTYREWGEVSVLPSRARLSVRREGDAVRVQNALGAKLEEGYLRLGGQHYAVPAMMDGAEVNLGAPLPEGETPVSRLLSDAALGAGRLSVGKERFLAPLSEGGFIVRLGGVGMAPTSTVKMELEGGAHVVRGQLEEVRP
ncbi:hypothetical protein [Comamonas sp. JC664]|uniref:hypothetical protein n=1 Tax=Comamonas sp. JC664 TaxID=2801917 RepID=UPI00174A23DA|nr:hypothetical protein [Comamonas sp. JC664]MBL0694749.1 hypothetical protein [Comamonas sp. JC664]GHG94394.1 hypothetical protein GCM10012319_57270 [Comamonas sp. KCTC 72670]